MRRREFLVAMAAAPAAGLAASAPPTCLGVVEHSFGIRAAADRSRGVENGLQEPLGFLEFCCQLGARGVQLSLGQRDARYLATFRQRAAQQGMFVECSVRLPRDLADSGRFEQSVQDAKQAGASVLRTVTLGGRRYETLPTAGAFHEFRDRAWKSLVLAEPILRRLQMPLAVENHKDFRSPELVELLKRLESPWVGACVDMGNNLALLEDPTATVEELAPWALSVHLKDAAVCEYEDGFLLADVRLGRGILDLPRIVGALRQARPHVHFNLEMITRDPLKVPCLTPKYWATMAAAPGRQLAETLRLVRARSSRQPLPTVSRLGHEALLKEELDNVTASLTYAREQLGL